MTSRFLLLLIVVFVLVLPVSSLAFFINGKPAVEKWSPFHNSEKPSDSLKAPDTNRQAAFLDFLTEDIKEETLFPARIAEIVDNKNESFLALVALLSLLFLARLYYNSRQTRPNSLDTDDLARLQILKDTAGRLLERYKRKSKVIDLNDFRN